MRSAPPDLRAAAAAEAAATGGARRLRTAELLQLIEQVARLADADVSALVVIRAGRSDRVEALAQQPTAAAAMREISNRISGALRIEDRFALVSHDEIWILLPSLTSASVATLAAARLRDVLAAPIRLESGSGPVQSVRMRPAVGALLFGSDPGDLLELVRQADATARRASRAEDRILVENAEQRMGSADRAVFEAALREALHANELDLMLQPKVELRSGRVASAEALIRWTRPDGSVVGGDVVAATCNEAGLIDALTHFVVRGALRARARLAQRGIEVSIAINLDAATIEDPRFPDLVEQASETWGVSPRHLVFEITESSLVNNEDRALEFMGRLRELGSELSIDDFGTGYSSLAYLRRFPLSELKIDKLFVRNMVNEPNDQRIVRSLIALCRSFELRCVAEGIEDDATRSLLVSLGCDIGQGFLFSRPIASDRFGDWVRDYDAARGTVERELLIAS
ncbi:MAG: EAL domain-containing protein [Burkholderiales bacterium]|nr:MAG: EAL domain-containing protein [Burkholderiales bacterium]